MGAIPRIAERLSAALCGAPDGAPMWGSTIISGVVNPLSIFQNRGPDGVTLRTSRITLDMATKVYVSVAGSSLVKVQVYLTPEQRQHVRERAARRGVSMSEYLKQLIDREQRGSMKVD